MSDALCTNYGCDYQLDLDGQVTCVLCGSKNESGYSTGKWSDDDDWHGPFTPFLGQNK